MFQVMIQCADPSNIDVSAPISKGAGWGVQRPILIDFGRAIDLKLYDEGTRFCSDVMADTFECLEMREGRPWTFQVAARNGLRIPIRIRSSIHLQTKNGC